MPLPDPAETHGAGVHASEADGAGGGGHGPVVEMKVNFPLVQGV
jgi:hypothetical protein